jgi:hypothetical protein
VRRLYTTRIRQADKVFPGIRLVPFRVINADELATGRSYAWTYSQQPVSIEAHQRLADEPRERQDVILRHEIAHAIDALYSRRTVAARLDLPEGWDGWPKTPEKYADAIAEALWGQRILYDGDDVQTLSVGTWPRPSYLPH